jgi:hypothetical protein
MKAMMIIGIVARKYLIAPKFKLISIMLKKIPINARLDEDNR